MRMERIFSIELPITECPGDAGATQPPTVVRYCDECRRWGRRSSPHLCGRNWHLRLSDLLIELDREGAAVKGVAL